jgi:hypothetical protein
MRQAGEEGVGTPSVTLRNGAARRPRADSIRISELAAIFDVNQSFFHSNAIAWLRPFGITSGCQGFLAPWPAHFPVAAKPNYWEKIMRIELAFAGMLLIGLVGCTTVGPTANDIPASIATATTPGDHLKIADYFTQKAVDYDAEAARHELMARSYYGRPKGESGSMTSHCRTLRDQFASAAKEARAISQEHRQVAAKGGN